jgi:hypothetical protein
MFLIVEIAIGVSLGLLLYKLGLRVYGALSQNLRGQEIQDPFLNLDKRQLQIMAARNDCAECKKSGRDESLIFTTFNGDRPLGKCKQCGHEQYLLYWVYKPSEPNYDPALDS